MMRQSDPSRTPLLPKLGLVLGLSACTPTPSSSPDLRPGDLSPGLVEATHELTQCVRDKIPCARHLTTQGDICDRDPNYRYKQFHVDPSADPILDSIFTGYAQDATITVELGSEWSKISTFSGFGNDYVDLTDRDADGRLDAVRAGDGHRSLTFRDLNRQTALVIMANRQCLAK